MLDEAVREIAAYRKEIEVKLLEFARTDLLFFWSEKRDLYLRQKNEWQPILEWAGQLMDVAICKTDKLGVPDNEKMQIPLKNVLAEMSNKEIACYYAAALNMKSVLLALALVKGRISAEDAGRLSYLEELWQNEIWGSDNEAVQRRESRCTELREIESYLKNA